MSDEYLVECKIDDDDDESDEEVKTIQPSLAPPPQFSSTSQVSLTQVETRDPYGVNNHLKVRPTKGRGIWFILLCTENSDALYVFKLCL